jgi:hypothetical protein
MLVEVLGMEGCPHRQEAVSLLQRVLRDLVPDVDCGAALTQRVVEREIRTSDEAERERFVGSPTIRVDGVDGVDVEPMAPRHGDGPHLEGYGVQCRRYHGSEHPGVPAEEVVRRAIAAALAKEGLS